MSNLVPEYMTKNELLLILEDITNTVHSNDSFGGFIEFDAMDPNIPDDKTFAVKASYRIGNSFGQGGIRMVGTIPSANDETKD